MDTWQNNADSLRPARSLPLAVLLLLGTFGFAQTKNSCLDCHSALPDPLGVSEAMFTQDIHAQKGLTCVSCHGGDRASDDPDKAMSRKAGWKGKIDRKQIPQLCGSCHSDPAYLRQFNPSLRTDQLSQYHTSVHGNHGATPPGVDKVQNVCANCHTFQAQMYEKSSHKAAFEAASLPGCVVCHGNHGIRHPTDAKLGTGPDSVCMRCHTPGDTCDQARVALLSGLTRLDEAIKRADQVLGVAESSGMEVSEARLGQDQARDWLTKARVTIHSFRKDLVDQDIQAGLKVTAKNLQAGKQAMVERNHRRVGLGISLLANGLVLLGLRLYIKQIES